ncbi:class I tRNA ligase family protein, partial [Candidatus Saccharibacteria bacterium]|nr:class I tRNA ligase family protein [Candidatus Saccharibacteria bacterium]
PITDFIDDLSVWYLRRSRDRLKGDDMVDKTKALATLRYVLQNLSLVMAPAMPFYAEYLWQQVKEEDGAESVHLAKWPSEGKVDDELLAEMAIARNIVTQALEARTKANIKVRQPIASVSGPELRTELQPIVLDELNAKMYLTAEQVQIDTTLTPELIAEGAVRELMRAVQGMRKDADLEPQDKITLTVQASAEGKAAISAHQNEFRKTVGAETLTFADTEGIEVKAGEYQFVVSFNKN